jgi:hypothetical protein
VRTEIAPFQGEPERRTKVQNYQGPSGVRRAAFVLVEPQFAGNGLSTAGAENGSFIGLWAGLQAMDFAHAGEGSADVGNGNGAADDKGDVEGVNHFVAGPAFFGAAHEVVGDAVVATEDSGGDQSQEFLGLGAERARFVSLMVESEEAFDAEVAAAEDLLVEVGAAALEVIE